MIPINYCAMHTRLMCNHNYFFNHYQITDHRTNNFLIIVSCIRVAIYSFNLFVVTKKNLLEKD